MKGNTKMKRIVLIVVIFLILSIIGVSVFISIKNANKRKKIKTPTIGDYTNFKVEEGHTYESSNNINGSYIYKFTSKNINWRILKVDSDGKNLILISEEPIKDDVDREISFKGKLGYWNVEKELNNICSIYKYGEGIKEVRSINGEDINTLIGYDKNKEVDGTDSKYGKSYFTFDNGIFLNEDGTEEVASKDNVIEPKFTTYSYSATSYIDDTSKEYELLFDNKNYWINTRGVGFCSVWAHFNIMSVNNGFVIPNTLFSSYDKEYEISNSIQPIIIMEENVKINEDSGDGTKDNPYKLIVE